MVFEMAAVNHKSPVANSVRKGQEDAVVRQHSRQLGGERTSLSNNIDPPVNILLKPKQETTDFMLAETYKLLILRIMTTKVKSMENIYPPVHVKGYQPGFQGKNTGCLKKGEFYKTFTIIEVCPNKITNKMKQGLTMETRPLWWYMDNYMMIWWSSYDFTVMTGGCSNDMCSGNIWL